MIQEFFSDGVFAALPTAYADGLFKRQDIHLAIAAETGACGPLNREDHFVNQFSVTGYLQPDVWLEIQRNLRLPARAVLASVASEAMDLRTARPGKSLKFVQCQHHFIAFVWFDECNHHFHNQLPYGHCSSLRLPLPRNRRIAVEKYIKHRKNDHRQRKRRYQSAEDYRYKRLLDFGTRAGGVEHRQKSHQRSQGGHQQGPHAKPAGLEDSVMQLAAAFAQLVKEADEKTTLLNGDSQQSDH